MSPDAPIIIFGMALALVGAGIMLRGLAPWVAALWRLILRLAAMTRTSARP